MATPSSSPYINLPTCYDYAAHEKYYCNWGYTCCGSRSCCLDTYHSHAKFASSQWFWLIWASMIILVCCCSYLRRRQATGDGFIPVAFYRNRNTRSQRTSGDGQESEEELLPANSGNGVFFLPPGNGDQSQWMANSDWYRANKPPPYSLASSSSPSQAAELSSTASPSSQPSTVDVTAACASGAAPDVPMATESVDCTVAAGLPASSQPTPAESIQLDSVQATLAGGSASSAGNVAPSGLTSQTLFAAPQPSDALLGPPPAYSDN
eukprot:scpid71002/ scgid8715/ 